MSQLKDRIDLTSIRRVLVTKLRHHGDVLLTAPVFSALKTAAPHLEIDALVYRDTADMLSGHPAISHIHAVDRSAKQASMVAKLRAEWALFQQLQARKFDLLVHLTESYRGAWMSNVLNTRYAVTRDYGAKRGWIWRHAFSHHYRVAARGRHTVESHLDALRRLGIQIGPDRRVILNAGEAAATHITDMLTQHQLSPQRFIHLHPTSRWLFKCWSVENYSLLIDRLREQGHQVVLTAAPNREEMDMIERITTRLHHSVVNLSGTLTLKQLAALTAQAQCFVGVDSAPMHIAAAMNTPVVVLFGPSGELEWGPWLTPSIILTSSHPCRPCGIDGCGGGKVSECLMSINVERVLAAITQHISA